MEKCNDARKAYHGFVNGTTDLGFSRSAAFGGIPTLKPLNTVSQGHLAPRPVIHASTQLPEARYIQLKLLKDLLYSPGSSAMVGCSFSESWKLLDD
jgi:hypothetical protein